MAVTIKLASPQKKNKTRKMVNKKEIREARNFSPALSTPPTATAQGSTSSTLTGVANISSDILFFALITFSDVYPEGIRFFESLLLHSPPLNTKTCGTLVTYATPHL